MVLTASFIPGASYGSSTFTIPWASVNTALTGLGITNITAADSTERLLFALCQILAGKNNAGTLTQYTAGAEVSNQGVISGTLWETAQYTFSSTDAYSFQLTFRMTSPAATAGNNIASV